MPALGACGGGGVPQYGFGNPFCFQGALQTFDACCRGGEAPPPDCFGPGRHGGVLSFGSCCFTGERHWLEEEGEVTGMLNFPIGGRGGRARAQALFGELPCAAGSHELEEIQDLTGRFHPGRCRSAGGEPYQVALSWSEASFHTTRWRLCAPAACSPQEVVLNLAPSFFIRATHKELQGAVVQRLDAKRLHLAGLPAPRNHTRTGTWGARSPPVDGRAMEEYLHSFRVCGRCERMARYGDARDGGYIMCDAAAGEQDYLGIYSYGIEYRDAWGESVSRATGVSVHQYDCTVEAGPATCEPPCSSVFHRECLAAVASNSTKCVGRPERCSLWRFGTLEGQLAANGHASAAAGQLLVKVDIEGLEWEVFCSASLETLQKFRQVVVEFHMPYVDTLMDTFYWETRMSALRNLLQVFVVVHVHVNGSCDPPGSCLEVTFVHQAFARRVPCSWPRRHATDAANDERSDPDPALLFARAARSQMPRGRRERPSSRALRWERVSAVLAAGR